MSSLMIPKWKKKVLVSDLDGTMSHFVTAYMEPALSYACAAIAGVFGLTTPEIAKILARAILRNDHEYPWLLEVSELRNLFQGDDEEYIHQVVVPFWLAWETAAHSCSRPCPDTPDTLKQLRERNVTVVCLTNAHDFCALLRLRAMGLDESISLVVGVNTPPPSGIDGVCVERRRRTIISQSKTRLICVPPQRSKPDPTAIIRVLAKLGFEPGDAIMTGDSLKFDGGVAANAGMDFVWMQHELLTTLDFDSLHGRARPHAQAANAVPMLGTANMFSELLPLFETD